MTGDVGLNKYGDGTLNLIGASSNTYTGPTTVYASTLALGKTGGTIAIPGDLIINPGTTVRLDNSNQTAPTGIVTVNGTFNGNGYANTFGSLTGSGTVNLPQNTLTVGTNNASTTFNGTLNGMMGNLTKTGTGTLTLGGTGANTFTGSVVVESGTLSLNKTGTTAIPGTLNVGDPTQSGWSGSAVLQSSNQIAATAVVNVYQSGWFNLSNFSNTIGSLTLYSGTSRGAEVSTGTGVLTMGGNVTLNVNETGATPATLTGNLNLGGATRTFNVGNGTAASDLIIPAIIGNGGLTKIGTGTLTLSGNNTYAGNTTVTAGTLLVNGANGLTQIVLNGGTLGGTGTVGPINMASMSSGTVAPGTTVPGILNSNCLTLNDAATFSAKLNGTTPATGYSQLNATGVVALNDATLNLSVGYVPQVGHTFTIINNDGNDPVMGTFGGLVEGSKFRAGGMEFQITYQGGDGNDVGLTVTTAPIPLYLPLLLR